ncbi:LysR family transcriptional regulator [Desertibaculum subflavum]|uniref:LysR family transcriptional regulator n=1 Tax=Desertibaculum subflavum TaxID=2268458 RepID=UPI000E674B9F
MRSLNLDHLRAFGEVVATGGFSAAAARLNLTQPAVSLQVRQLERRLGVELVERTGRRATPTAAGRELLAHIRSIDGAVAGAMEAMAAHATGVAGRVRLGTGATACIYLLPTVLRRLRKRYPGLEIVVGTGNTPDMLRAIEENTLDLGLVTLPAAGRALQVTPLLRDEMVAIAAPGDRRLPAKVTAAALATQPVVLYEPGAHTRRVVDDWFLAAGQSLKPAMQLGSVEAIKQLVGAGLGLGLLPRMAVAQMASRGPLAVRPLAPRLYRELGLVVRRDKPSSRGLAEVIRALGRMAKTGGRPSGD